MIYADLHVHSHYAFNTSRALGVETLAAAAARKGLNVIGTGDVLHPGWRKELDERLEPAGDGLYRLRAEVAAAVAATLPPSCAELPLFLATTELSTVYVKGGKTRRVHHLVMLPGLEAADALAERLGAFANLASDGRPVFKLDSRHLLEIVLETVPDAVFVPAHIWTPWYGVLGAGSGFDRIEDCYGDLSPEIFALETGLSADPAMIRRISTLDRFRLISSSDAHGPRAVGREATMFRCEAGFAAFRAALRTGIGYGGTVEVFPEHGKYYWDGHRACGVARGPSAEAGDLCPVCGKPLTIGVAHRVAALADRSAPEGTSRASAETAVRSLVSLAEILSQLHGVAATAKAVIAAHADILARLGPELRLLIEIPLADIGLVNAGLAEAIRKLRRGLVQRRAGYDGLYGEIRVASGVG
jgi:DNA helicase II / ATP-dependent DNA helicase PcrA